MHDNIVARRARSEDAADAGLQQSRLSIVGDNAADDQSDMAEAGGKDASQLDAALRSAPQVVQALLG